MITGSVKTGSTEMEYFSFGSGSRRLIILPGIGVQKVRASAKGVETARVTNLGHGEFGRQQHTCGDTESIVDKVPFGRPACLAAEETGERLFGHADQIRQSLQAGILHVVG